MSSQLGLLTTRRFLPLFVTQFCGAFNDNVLKNALVILIAFKTSSVLGIPSSQMVAVCGGIFILPFFLFSATSGQLADKLEKTRIVRWVKLMEIAIMVLATIGFTQHLFGLLLVVLFLMGLHSTFFGPVKYSILPQVLRTEELVAGNALIEGGTFLAILLGTILGGVMIARDPSGIAVSGALIAISLVGYLACLRIPPAPSACPDLAVQWNPIPPTVEIYRFTRANTPVFLSVVGISWFWYFGASLLSLFPPYCKELLGANEGVVTLFLAIFSIGIGVGSMLCERLSQGRLELGLVSYGSFFMTLFCMDLYFVGNPFAGRAAGADPLTVARFMAHAGGVRIVLDLLLFSMAAGLFIVPLYTLMQEKTPLAQRSRIIAGNNILNALFMVVASVMLMAMFAAEIPIPTMFALLAGINGVVTIAAYFIKPEYFWRFSTWIVGHLMYRIRTTGLERVPREGAAILVCNHVSFLDWLIVLAVVPRTARFVMDYNYAPGPLGRFLTHAVGVIPIATLREDPSVLRRSFERVADELNQGELVCIFPEGFITSTGEMQAFRKGVLKIVADTPVPVIPMALQGFWGSWFSREGGTAIRKWPKRFRSRIGFTIGAPIPPAEATLERMEHEVRALRGEWK